MPTAARIVGAIVFFVVGFIAAEAFKPQMPTGTQFGYFSLIVGGIGVLVGWYVMGALAGRGLMAAMSTGLRSSATIVFFALLIFSGQEMLHRSLKKLYHGPMDALQGMAGMIAKYLVMLANPADLVVLILGGMVAGAIVEFAHRRWR